VFNYTDKNGDGKISLDEFRQLAVMSGIFENEANLTKAFYEMDVNGDLHMELLEVLSHRPQPVTCPTDMHMDPVTMTCIMNSGTNVPTCPAGKYFDH
jgi:hypothetical protein